nr:NTF2 fold immunity protein [Novosphingobium sp. SG751A]
MLLLPQTAQAEPVECKKAVSLYQPEGGVIPSDAIAKNIANTYLSEVYGAQTIRAEFPLTAKIQDGVWTVEGNLPRGKLGGVAVIRLCRRNGTVLSIIHEK